jgi:hypothetical protein
MLKVVKIIVEGVERNLGFDEVVDRAAPLLHRELIEARIPREAHDPGLARMIVYAMLLQQNFGRDIDKLT